MAIRKDNSERNKPTKEEYDKIPETEFREAFKKYLSNQGVIATDGVDAGNRCAALCIKWEISLMEHIYMRFQSPNY